MRTHMLLIGLAALLCLAAPPAWAHPGNGIAVDDRGHVFFMDTGHGLWEIDPSGKLTSRGGPPFHFLALDRQGKFRQEHFSHLEKGDVVVRGEKTAFLLASSYPVAVGSDGAFYYPQSKQKGRVTIMRMAAGEEPKVFAELPVIKETNSEGQEFDAEWVWALAAGPGGSIYYSQRNAIRRIAPDGTVSLVAGDVKVPGCEHPPAVTDDHSDPGLYGLDVADDGTVYVAAATCSAVLKITRDGKVSVPLRATAPWSPQGLAVVGKTLYVLEYTYIPTENREEWLPRVRKVAPDGTVTILARIEGRGHARSSRQLPGIMELLSVFEHPTYTHAAVVHFPVVLFLLAVPATLLALVFWRRRAWRVQSLVLFLALVAACIAGERTGDSVEAHIPVGPTGVPAYFWQDISAHANAAGQLRVIAASGVLMCLVSLLPERRIRIAGRPYIQILGALLALGVAAHGSFAVAQVAHLGGQLVYDQGIGTDLLPTYLAANVSAETQAASRVAEVDPFAGGSAGEERTIAGVKFCWCPPGTFSMGSPRSEPERRPGENQVQVTLSKGFWMAKYEATQGDWKRAMGKLPGELTKELPEGDDYPVGNVNFAETEDYCQTLTEIAHASGELPQGWVFRLPTEAQWEYACRAGTTTATSFGDSLSSTQANFKGDKPYNGGAPGPSLGMAAKVGNYPANPWGLHDMHGNIFEWCRDWYHIRMPGGVDPDLHDAISTATKSENGGISRSRRGGAWTDQGWPCRSAFRLRYEPERRYDHIGFRIVAVKV